MRKLALSSRHIILFIVIAPPLIWILNGALRGELDFRDRYVVPILSSYVAQSPDFNDFTLQRFGPYQIVKLQDPWDLNQLGWEPLTPDNSDASTEPAAVSSPDWTDPSYAPPPFRISSFLPNVTKIAHWGHFIIGETTTKFFILDTNINDLEFFANSKDYAAGLTKMGIPMFPLIDVATIARSLSPSNIRPWAYQHMHCRWGHSDVWWNTQVTNVGFITCLFVGYLAFRRKGATKWMWGVVILIFSAGFGEWVNEVTSYYQAGPDMFAGAIIIPAYFIFGAFWGMGSRALLKMMNSNAKEHDEVITK
jgi:hypothetical protein